MDSGNYKSSKAISSMEILKCRDFCFGIIKFELLPDFNNPEFLAVTVYKISVKFTIKRICAAHCGTFS